MSPTILRHLRKANRIACAMSSDGDCPLIRITITCRSTGWWSAVWRIMTSTASIRGAAMVAAGQRGEV